MKVYISCFGSGLGHASRMVEVAGLLSESGTAVRFSSSGEVVDFIRSRGYECDRVPSADVRYTGSGEFSPGLTVAYASSILARGYQEWRDELFDISRFNPDVVVSDSVPSAVVAGRLRHKRVVTVANQLLVEPPGESPSVAARVVSLATTAGLRRIWRLSRQVLVPDLPPPYTISERNVWGSRLKNIRYVGFLVPSGNGVKPDGPLRSFSAGRKTRVFWQVSGPPSTRAALAKRALQLAADLSDEFVFVVSSGDPRGDTRARRFSGGWAYGWCPTVEAYFGACDVAIIRGGHGSIAQAIRAAKPTLVVPIPRQSEQEWNARKAAALGISLVTEQEDLTAAGLRESLRSLTAGGFAKKAGEVSAVAKDFDARAEVARAIAG